ncbi:NnrS family protein [Propionivibrio sp.]|uniref:NnrS family protein n=1 Tax=Propionivibrio sp. TaxID=2212460 RepID=UPI003BEF5B11
MLNIETPFTGKFAFLHTGFRPFFALATLGSALLMLLWLGSFGLGMPVLPKDYPPITWHAHEMIFGFGLAVVSGFLLTAVRNWTNLPTLTGYPLLALAVIWLLARVLPFFAIGGAWPALAELLFLIVLLVALTRPVVRVKQWNQMAIVGKVALFIPASLVFHLGVARVWPEGIGVGLYAGFYLILGLVLTLIRRVVPMFIENGLNNGFVTRNDPRVDRWSLVLFLALAIADVWLQSRHDAVLLVLVSVLAGLLAILHAWRLAGWVHPDVWKKPMIWVLVVAYGWLVLGFLLKALAGAGWASHSLAVHALAAGGIGMVTLGMMARVSLGHTGRNVNAPPRVLPVVFALAALAAACRVVGVWLLPAYYAHWILLGQALWVLAFSLFALLFLPIWVKARIDGRRG